MHTARPVAWLAAFLGVSGLAAIAALAFVAGRHLGPEHPVALPAGAAPVEPVVTPGGTAPEQRDPLVEWQAYAAALSEMEASAPRFDQVVNGIRVGPTAGPSAVAPGASAGRECAPGDGRYIDPARADGTPVGLLPAYVPSAAKLRERQAVACLDGPPVATWIEFGLAASDDLVPRLRAGESWFELDHGGTLYIGRTYVADPWLKSHRLSNLWRAATVHGLPAAIAPPIDPRGFGTGEIVIWDPASGVRTTVRGFNVSEQDLIRTAEGLYR